MWGLPCSATHDARAPGFFPERRERRLLPMPLSPDSLAPPPPPAPTCCARDPLLLPSPPTPTRCHISYRRRMPSFASRRCTLRWDRGSQWRHEEIAHGPWIRVAILQSSGSSPMAARRGCTPPPLAIPLRHRSSAASASCVRSARAASPSCTSPRSCVWRHSPLQQILMLLGAFVPKSSKPCSMDDDPALHPSPSYEHGFAAGASMWSASSSPSVTQFVLQVV
jgi:hypothetical protein